MPGLHLEIGAAYREISTGKIHLAVSTDLLVTYIKNRLIEVRDNKGFEVERHLPVRFLLDEWGVPRLELDRIAALYLNPPAHRNVGTRQRRNNRRGGSTEEFEIFRELRLHQVFHSQHKSG